MASPQHPANSSALRSERRGTSNSLNTELAIAHACNMALNKYASERLRTAHARLIAAVIENETPAFGLFTPASTYEYTAEHIGRIGMAWSEYIEAVSDEAADNSSHVDCVRPGLGDDVTEFIGQLEHAAYAQREDELEDVS